MAMISCFLALLTVILSKLIFLRLNLILKSITFFRSLAKDCGPISVPLNGTRLGGQTTYPNEMIFSCDDGFHLRGSNRRTCTADGKWSGLEATCQGRIPRA